MRARHREHCKMTMEGSASRYIKTLTESKSTSLSLLSMQFRFSALTSTVVAALSSVTHAASGAVDTSISIAASHEEIFNWISTTDANLTFVGKSLTEVTPLDTIIISCTDFIFRRYCGGQCIVHIRMETAACIPLTSTAACLRATPDLLVASCTSRNCADCIPLATCGVRLEEGYCFAPNTHSIRIGA